MLAQRNRFHGRKALARVYKQSKTVRSGLVSLRFTPSSNKEYRCAVVVSKKVHKSAVVRNRIRRRIYEVVRTIDPQPESVDLIITVFSEKVFAMSYKELKHEVEGLIRQTGVFNNSKHR